MSQESIEEDEEDVKLNPTEMRFLATIIRYQAREKSMSNAAIGRFWGLPRETVRDIVLGKTWK